MTRLEIQKDAEQFLEGKIMKAKKYLIFTVVALVLFGTFYGPQTQNDAFGNPYQTVTVRAKGKSGSWDRDPIRVFLRMGTDQSATNNKSPK